MSAPLNPNSEGRDPLRLSRWEVRGEGRERRGVEVAVDWRSALRDALLDHDVNTGKVLDAFEELCLDPAYEGER